MDQCFNSLAIRSGRSEGEGASEVDETCFPGKMRNEIGVRVGANGEVQVGFVREFFRNLNLQKWPAVPRERGPAKHWIHPDLKDLDSQYGDQDGYPYPASGTHNRRQQRGNENSTNASHRQEVPTVA